jgi:hypothetical protein
MSFKELKATGLPYPIFLSNYSLRNIFKLLKKCDIYKEDQGEGLSKESVCNSSCKNKKPLAIY